MLSHFNNFRMADLPVPNFQKRSHEYRICPTDWRAARKFTDFYREADRHTYGDWTEGTEVEAEWFLRDVQVEDDASETIKEVAEVLEYQRVIEGCPHLRMKISGRAMPKGPGDFCLHIQPLNKLRKEIPWVRVRNGWKVHGRMEPERTMAQPPALKIYGRFTLDDFDHKVVEYIPDGAERSKNAKWTSAGHLLRTLHDECVGRLRSLAVTFARASFADLDTERDSEVARVRKEKDLLELERTKCLYQYKEADRAEEAIDVEIHRRIVRSRWPEAPLVRFPTLPPEIKDSICGWAMNVTQTIRPWCYGIPGSYSLIREQAPEPTVLRQVSGLREETDRVLFTGTTFSFTMATALHCFLDMEGDDSLQHLRRIELHFEPDVMLKYLNDFLPFNFYPDSHFLRNHVGSLRIQDAMKELNRHAKKKFDADGTQLKIIITFPYTSRMWQARFEGRCHTKLCKWTVKAAQRAVTGYPCLEVVFRGAVTNGNEDMTKAARSELKSFEKSAATTAWQALEAEPGIDIGVPPPCRCNGQTLGP